YFDGDRTFSIGKSMGVGKQWETLKTYTAPNSYKDFSLFRFCARGDSLSVFADNKLLMEVRDSTHASGWPGLGAFNGRILVKNPQVEIFDASSASQANAPVVVAKGSLPGTPRILQDKTLT